MDKNQIIDLISGLLAENFGIDRGTLTQDSRLRDIGVDSLHVVDIMLTIEDTLGVKMDDLSFPPNPSIAEVADTVARNLTATAR